MTQQPQNFPQPWQPQPPQQPATQASTHAPSAAIGRTPQPAPQQQQLPTGYGQAPQSQPSANYGQAPASQPSAGYGQAPQPGAPTYGMPFGQQPAAGATAAPAPAGQQVPQLVMPAQPQLPQVGGYVRPASTRNRKLAGTMALLIIGSILAAIATLFALGNGIVGFLLGVLPCTAMLVAAIACYMWLDRWEPEPYSLLGLGFVWGGGIAVVGLFAFQIFESMLGLVPDEFGFAVVQAPVTEEIVKGSFLFLMAYSLRRRELNSLVDYLVYAGFVGLGFAFVEDLLYFARAETPVMTGMMVVMRLWMGIFAHPLFTSMTAFGLYLGRKKGGAWAWLGPIGGLLVAMAFHALWNGSASLGLFGYFGAYVLVMVPTFAAIVWLAIKSRKAEGATVARQLPRMVTEQLVNPYEAAWLGNLEGRSTRRRQAGILGGGKAAAEAVGRFTDAVTELAFLRDRLDKGQTPKLAAEHDDLVLHVMAERQHAMPALRAIVNAPLATTTATPPPPPASQTQGR